MRARTSNTVRMVAAALLVCLIGGCATPHAGEGHRAGVARAAEQNQELDTYSGLMEEALALLSAGKPGEAIAGPLQTTIQHFEASAMPDTRYFCARDVAETLFYLAGSQADSAHNKQAVVLAPHWAYAYHYQAYALVELGRLDEAEISQKKAIALSPRNAFFLSELAHIYQSQQKLAKSLATYEDAERAAESFSPDANKLSELTRALRGQGFILIEMYRLDEAEARFRATLKLDPDDQKAKHELGYIDELRAQ